MVNLIIDNRPVEVEDGATILDAARQLNIRIPTLCYLDLHELKMVNKVASCRICSVEVEGRRNLAPACATPVYEGMKVATNSRRVLFTRRRLLELILSNHPFECLICAKSTDCELQTLAWEFGINTQRYQGERTTFPIDKTSGALRRDPEKCIMCRRCDTMCNEVQTVGALTAYGRGFNVIVGPAEMKPFVESNCTYCGQCVSVCPTAALTGHGYMQETWNAIFDPTKTVVVQVAPAIRAAIGEEFDIPAGTAVTGKLAAGLRRLGFDAVFDTTWGADLTILEEAKEIIDRVTKNEKLPILTSCCPAWVNFINYQFPSLKYMPSSCKSPQQMTGAIAKSYYAQKIGVKPEDMVVVSVMPCIAKKYETHRPELQVNGIRDVDYSITTRELSKMFKEGGIDLRYMPDEEFDNPLGESTGAGVIFGVTGGVLEAALRTVYEQVTGKELTNVNFEAVRGLKDVREATIDLGGKQVRVAAGSGLGNARTILEAVEKGTSQYDIIEIMACPGGCVNGGGQPYTRDRLHSIELRTEVIYQIDEASAIRKSHENPSIIRLYEEFLGEPGSHKAHELLHTEY
jgi:NADH-quinone oxidoreductase subunit G